MSIPMLEIIQPGALTTVQDRGRYGYQHLGVPVSGAMDEFALRVANVLVGNEDTAAGLEMTVVGPRLKFLSDACIAITGADLSAEVDGVKLPRWQSVQVSAESILSFSSPSDGARAYLAIKGGIDVPVVMGSRSTYTTSSIGGLKGRSLEPNDIISTFHTETNAVFSFRKLPPGYLTPAYGEEHELRIVLGPQHNFFNQETIFTFLSSTYKISGDSDRMGYRLHGPEIEHETGPDIISDGSPAGAVQISGDGSPKILLADRGTTGGYAKIATVISADLSKLAQALPDHSVTFQAVTPLEGQQIRRELEQVISAIPLEETFGFGAKLSLTINGDFFEVVENDGSVLVSNNTKPGTNPKKRRASVTTNSDTYDFEVDIYAS